MGDPGHRLWRTRIGEAVQGKTQLDQSGARMLGVVMNKIPTGRRGYSYYYRHYYTYDGEGDTKRRGAKNGGHELGRRVDCIS